MRAAFFGHGTSGSLSGGPVAPVLQDRVEVVQFTQPGRHLLICAVLPHWVNDKVHGWVNVLP